MKNLSMQQSIAQNLQKIQKHQIITQDTEKNHTIQINTILNIT